MSHTEYRELLVFLTGKCNMECSYCFVDRKNFRKINPREKNFKEAIDLFLNSPGKEKTISFYGGEPLMEFGQLKNLSLYARKKNDSQRILNITLSTNGT
ncbi:MAG: radical SAM protein, partial [Candidatus Nealsonbacteria bacterium]